MRRLVPLLLILLTLPVLTIAQDAPPRTFKHGWFSGAMKDDLTLNQGGARDAEGNLVIQNGDRLLTWNGAELPDRDAFCRKLYASKPGEIVTIEFERKSKDTGKPETLSADVKLGDPNEMFANVYKHRDLRKRTYDWKTDSVSCMSNDLLRRKLRPLMEEHSLQAEWKNLTGAHERQLDVWDAFESTSLVELLLSDPTSAHAVTHEATDGLAASFRYGDSGFTQLYPHIAKLMDRKPEVFDAATVELPKVATTKAEAASYRAKLAKAYLLELDSSYAAREADGKQWLELGKKVRAFDYVWRGAPGHEACVEVVHELRQTSGNASAVVARLDWSLAKIEELAEGYHEAHNRNESLPVPVNLDASKLVEGEAVFMSSPYGLIAIGGEGDNVWYGGSDLAPAVILDLGGDDAYINCARGDAGCPVSIVIDRSGDDHYFGEGKWGIGCGVLGTGIIHDYEGDDTYECGEWGIGAAFGGVGIVLDRAGNDRYLGGDYTCGVAAYGVGGLIDLGGNDVYDSHVYSVGVGLPGGVGFVLDKGGDDSYRCTGKYGSGYGTEGEYTGWGIGCGFGFRTLASGGTGLVVDTGGNDIYNAGEFGLGCGYYLGTGIVRDIKGDDIYHSSRYGLATGAHYAAGLFMDDRGHDTYVGKTAASMGGVWDIVTGYFYEGAGNDTYRCDGLGLGACSQNGVGIFWDRQGDDYYRGRNSTLGHAGQTTYGAGRLAENFGFFFDSGGSDNYPPGRENDSKLVTGQYGIFVDD